MILGPTAVVPRRTPPRRTPLWRTVKRWFSYEDTLAYRLHGPKPLAVVVHPVVTAGKSTWGKPWPQILWDAEEALGLARANRWDLLPGPNETPHGGWDDEAFATAEAQDLLRRQQSGAWTAPEGWHLDRGEEESDDEYDVHEAAWQNGVIKRQFAETTVVKVRLIDSNTYFGKGKVAELAMYIAQNPCDYLFVNTTLTPTQSRNLETVLNNAVAAGDAQQRRDENRGIPPGTKFPGLEVIDRNRLVLEIFNLRARTPQAKVQVALARLEYMKGRLSLCTKKQMKDTIRLLQQEVGPFKEVQGYPNNVYAQYHYETSPFETEKSLLRQAELRFKKMLETEKKVRKKARENREGVPTIGIVGYTNAGKTSLMNRLTDAGLRERDLLFQTLDTTMRRVKLPSGGHAIIADSIGFIQHLPHNLFAAFQATLEEIIDCDVLLHVRDIAHPQRTMQKLGSNWVHSDMSQPLYIFAAYPAWESLSSFLITPQDDFAQMLCTKLPKSCCFCSCPTV
ncbi:GTPase HflX (GTP-binding protein HflX) [Durusdinium trenchii]|uniref:GTPase HflX (GTP-binding protein HflX) n=1 Tax=Durusdinium trenchii TaxID=1381693 RepID=A0ABP0HSB0_9DINO